MKMFMYGIYREGKGSRAEKNWTALGPRSVNGITIYQRAYNGIPDGIAYARPLENGFVNGTLWEIPDEDVLNHVDHVEQHPIWYRRVPVTTNLGEECQMYIMQNVVEDQPNTINVGPDWSGWTQRNS